MRSVIQTLAGAAVLFVILLLGAPTALATCGDFVTFYDYGDGLVEEREPIENCSNPFNADTPDPFAVELRLADQLVTPDSVITVGEGEQVVTQSVIEKTTPSMLVGAQLFLKVGPDYVWQASLEEGSDLIDPLSEGEYVAVITREEPPVLIGSSSRWKQWLAKLLLPTPAYANYPDYVEVVVIEFQVEYEVVEPTGASSVLFLPGIQASRLYTDGLLGTENRLWEPNRNNDVELLEMTEVGESVNDIYTRDVVDEIFGGQNVYKGFLQELLDFKEEGLIADYESFAYDWRYNVFDVASQPVKYPDGEAKSLVEEVKRLSAESYTGKVTIVAHSNGGLVAKALLHEFGDGELAGLIDKVVMVGTPQLGTPKAVGSLLHGLDQSSPLGILFNAPTARAVTKNMPGAYGLLPSPRYFTETSETIITYDSSAVALPISTYGDFREYNNFIEFLTDQKNTRNEVNNISQPIVLTDSLLENNATTQNILDDWVAPAGVEVYQVAGTGLATISGFYYREFSCQENPACVLTPFLKPVPQWTVEGDETVVLESAIAYEGEGSTLVVDLKEEGRQFLETEKSHINLTESNSVQDFVKSVVLYPYLADSIVVPEFSRLSSRYTIIGVHSPVSIVVKNNQSEVTGRMNGEVVEEIPGASYVEFAGSKYVIVPAEEEIVVFLQGEAVGRYSLTIEELTETSQQTLLQEIIGATSTESMVVEFTCSSGVCGTVTVDYDADGKLDAQFDWSGGYQEVQQDSGIVSELVVGDSGSVTTSTRIDSRVQPIGVVAGISTSSHEEELRALWDILLQVQVVIDQLNLYYNKD